MVSRCLVVDDNPIFLAAATTLLEREGLTIVAVASTPEEALQRSQALKPDVVLVDISLAGESGFDLARRLVDTELGHPTVILISTHAEADFADLIKETPAAGFISKSKLSAESIRRLTDLG